MRTTQSEHKISTAQQLTLKFGLSAIASTVAETVTFPLDITKTRLQAQGEHARGQLVHGARRKGMLSTAAGIATEEGITKLWFGLTPAISRHIVYTGTRMGFYEYIRDNIFSRTSDGGRISIWQSAVCGVVAGSSAQFIANPTDVVKIQMQMDGRRLLEGKTKRFHSAAHACSCIYKERGFFGMWRGWAPNVQRAGLVNMGDLATYDTVKQYLLRNTNLEDNWVTHSLSSGCAGFVAAILSTPADVVKTRIMNQPHDSMGRPKLYHSSLDCLRKTAQKEGFPALYKGFFPMYLRMAPWSLTFWLSYEEIRKVCGVKSF